MTVTDNPTEEIKHPVCRILAVLFIFTLNVRREHTLESTADRAYELSHALYSDIELYSDSDLNITLYKILNRVYDIEVDSDSAFYFDSELASSISDYGIFSHVDFGALVRSIEILESEKKNETNGESDEGYRELMDRLDVIWVDAFKLSAELMSISKEDSRCLSKYFYACELMIRCKEGAVRVSPDVWAGIESRILTVPAASEAAAD